MTLEHLYNLIREEERRRHEKWWAWLESTQGVDSRLTPKGGAARVAPRDKGRLAR